ncbi:aspartate aminotransferase family protein [Tichowtungia aerotolerans]|uniref:Acetylornithine aminotransferase n=1 Tax=Tichowtungia aerotolerans TaxID=2697043 RepID=A0A6P1MEK9_9BACT|nr:aspartate aminotransferase family protein [Tichowtungia aerotolerans]QHI70046.1 acetylornithine/succinylornithine family transaminase [Tichowtungia aerotolerans]
MNTAEIADLQKQFLIPTYAPQLALVKGSGTKVWDADGKEYLDFLAGIAVLNVGHCHPNVVKAVQDQAATLMHVSNLYYNEKQPQLAKALAEKAGGGKCFFCNSGAEANEGLIKLARLWGSDKGKFEVVTMKNSFHGRTLATLTATGQDKVQKGFYPLPEGFAYAEFNNLESVKTAITEKTAAVLVEAVQGEGGIIPADSEFIAGLRTLCDEKNILLLFDEVQAGIGRTGKWFGFQNYDVQPDAFSLAKALGNGFPIGAVVASPEVADTFQPGNHATTFGGTPLACAAALAVLETIEQENLLENAKAMGTLLLEKLQVIADQYDWIECARGTGLMVGLVLNDSALPLQKKLQEKGLLTLATAVRVLRILPPLNVTVEDVEKAVALIEDACSELDSL